MSGNGNAPRHKGRFPILAASSRKLQTCSHVALASALQAPDLPYKGDGNQVRTRVSTMLPERSGLIQLDKLDPLLCRGTRDPRLARTTAQPPAPPSYHSQVPGKPGQVHKALRLAQTKVKEEDDGMDVQECPAGSKR